MEERQQREINQQKSSINVTDDREAYPKLWYVARVQMHCEKKAAQKIDDLGYETYIPVKAELRQWSDRKKIIERILIPMMIFFRADQQGAKEVQRLTYVYDLLKAPGSRTAATIPEDQIERLRFMIDNSQEEVTIEQNPIKEGDKVRVIGGSLKGLEGYATSTEDEGTKISIIIDNLFCACVKISPKDLEKVE